jgi:starch synthase
LQIVTEWYIRKVNGKQKSIIYFSGDHSIFRGNEIIEDWQVSSSGDSGEREGDPYFYEVIRLSGMNLIIDDTDHPLIIKVASIQSARMQVYFIDNDDYFQRKHTVSDSSGREFEDNDERALFFARGVIETVKKLRWAPDIVHCHGWMSSLVPVYLRSIYSDDPLFHNYKIVYSVYNNDFKTPFRSTFADKLRYDGIDGESLKLVKNPDFINVSKLAIKYSDAVIIGSDEINTELVKYIETLNKPVLSFQDESGYIDAYNDFYDRILSE